MPSSGALFGSAATRSQSKNLVELKAGKMSMKGKMVHPDKRKGLLYVYQSDDSLMHFCWKDRTSGTVEDDLIIFPDDCEFKRVDQCTTGRVYVLKFKSSSRKFFFWVQEPKTDKDEDNCKKINEMLNNPPTPGANRSGGTTPDGDLQNLLGSMSQQQLMQLFGTFGSGGSSGAAGQLGGLSSLLGTMNRPSSGNRSSSNSTTAATTQANIVSTPSDTSTRTSTSSSAASSRPSTATSETAAASAPAGAGTGGASSGAPANPIQLSDLQRFLSNLTQSPTSPGNVDLSDALNSESIAGVLADPNLVRQLSPHLPNVGETEGGSAQQLRSTLTSPQFQQAMTMFSAALQSGQLGPVVQQFEVGENAVSAANQGNMEEFVKALEETDLNKESKDGKEGKDEEEVKQPEKKKKTEEEEKEKKKKKDKDEEDKDQMALD